MKMQHLIATTLAALVWAGLSSPAEARDHCGGGHGHYHGGYSSFGFSFGFPLFYSRPVRVYEDYGYDPGYRGYDDPLAEVQVELARRGYYRGVIDGVIGPASRSAIRRYQYDRGYPVTGRVDYPLLRMLGIR